MAGVRMRMSLSERSYLERERAADERSEFIGGEIVAMAGANRRHVLINSNLEASMRKALARKPCEIYRVDMKVRIKPTGEYCYPDLAIACDKPEFLDDKEDVLLNPKVIFEVLSGSTAKHDRGIKLDLYLAIPSLLEYLLVSQDSSTIQHYLRDEGEEWRLKLLRSLSDDIALEAFGIKVPIRKIYQGIKFPIQKGSQS